MKTKKSLQKFHTRQQI